MTGLHHVAPPSERTFGLTFAAVCAAVAARMWWRGRITPAAIFVALAVLFALVAAAAPRVLAAPNRLWFRLGMRLSRFTSPIVIGAMFLLIVTPLGIAMRLFGRDPLLLHERRDSYWVPRDPPGPAPDSFHHQF